MAEPGSETSYRAVFESVADAVLIADDGGRCVDANPAASTLLGYSRAQLQGMPIADLIGVAPAWTDAGFRQFRETGYWHGILDVRRQDGRVVPVEARATPLTLPSATLYVGVLRERTALSADSRETPALLLQTCDSCGRVLDQTGIWRTWDEVVTARWDLRFTRCHDCPAD